MTALRAVPDQPRRGVLYLRQSTEKEETISDAIQRTAGTDYCVRNGIELVTIRDQDYPSLENGEIWEQHTGRVWHKRKGVQRAMALVESGDVEVIVLWKWSRLSRRKLHWALAEEQVEQLGGTIESATEQADLTTSAGRFSRNVLVDLAEMQSDQIGEGWKEAHANRRARGLPATGGRRFGYDWHRATRENPEQYAINEQQAEAVRWAYEQYIQGSGWTALVWELNRKGVTTARGKAWSVRSLSQYLDSGFAAGLLPRTPVKENKRVTLPFAERVWDDGAHPAIVTADTWNSYRAARRSRTTPPRTINAAHPLAGLIFCGDCGAAMHRKPSGRYIQFVCGKWRTTGTGMCVSVTEAVVHRTVLAWLQALADDVDHEAERIELSKRGQLRHQTNAESAAREVRELDRQLTELTRHLTQGIIPQAAYVSTRDEITRDRDEAQARLDHAESQARLVRQPPVKIAAALISDWDTLTPNRRRALLGEVLTSITIHPPEQGQRNGRVVLDSPYDDVCALR